MKLFAIITIIIGLAIVPISTQESDFNHNKLKTLDAAWEKAQLELNFDFIESLLAEDFIWV
ncbi:nuclear transport factor 2 family protein [Winogradskyella sp. PG-2]|uniref:nuclear transport factor 2 family protein n=1 Tax=Winogradskyella sp. PG-2 TaxID=754409 RepID=UPI0004588946|nr:nuclear transport factor 2 family protein [Winogradskyella sp. PG-2]BAO76977.1 hypothetical protein WPG_2747 [Winogradskyella sp. PG-2]